MRYDIVLREAQQLFQLLALFGGGVFAIEASGLLQLSRHRMQRTGPMIGRRLAANPEVRLLGEPLAESLHEPRLADPRFA